ncbi:MAG: glycosyltransferase [Alphaproteobacteria bacterium]
MNVLLVIEAADGGCGLHVLDLAAGLAKRGHKVTLVYSPLRAGDWFIKAAHKLPLHRCEPLDMAWAVGPSDLTTYFRLRQFVKQYGPYDIIHSHSSKAGALCRALPKRYAKATIYTPHGIRTIDPNLGDLPRFIYGTIEKVLGRWRSDALIPVSMVEKAHIDDAGMAPNRTYLVHNGLAKHMPLSRRDARREMGIEESEVIAGFVGRLADPKNPARFVEAVNIARESAPSLRGIVIGDGPLKASAEEKNTQHAVSFLGARKAAALMPGFDFLVMTSSYEAMPYTLLEALHARLPIISTRVGGTAETIIEGENGYTIEVDAPPKALADTITSLALDNEKRATFAAASAKLAQARTDDTMVDATLEVYAQAMANRRN